MFCVTFFSADMPERLMAIMALDHAFDGRRVMSAFR